MGHPRREDRAPPRDDNVCRQWGIPAGRDCAPPRDDKVRAYGKKKAAPLRERLFIGLRSGYFLASARFFSWKRRTISSWTLFGTGSYLANSIENSPLP